MNSADSPVPNAEPTSSPELPLAGPEKQTFFESELATSGSLAEGSAAPLMEVKVGVTLGGYRLVKKLGEGGMGFVFEAEDARLKRHVAMKVMRPDVAANENNRQRFTREAQAAALVEHDHIVPILTVGEENNVPFIVMPFLKGEPLDARLKKGRLQAGEIIAIARQTAEGLAAAHEQGLIHRDIKPANIWLEESKSATLRVKILDFGLARISGEEKHLTQSGAVMGTPAYMAPEQARGREVDHRADLFSLGCILYEMGTGTRPFIGPDTMAVLTSLALDTPAEPHKLNPQLPPALSQLTMQLLEKDAAKRTASAGDVVETLKKLQPENTVVVIAQALPAAEASPWADIDASNTEMMPPPLVEELPSTASTLGKKPESPVGRAAPRASKSKRRLLLAVGLAGLLALLGGGVFYFVTDKGTIEITTDDEDIKIVVLKNGKEVEILDPRTKKSWSLSTGAYTLKLKDDPDGFEIALPKERAFQLQRGGHEVVSIRRKDIGPSAKEIGGAKSVNADELPAAPLAKYALEFDGKSTYADLPVNIAGDGNLTIEAWAVPASYNGYGSVLESAGGSIRMVENERDGKRIECFAGHLSPDGESGIGWQNAAAIEFGKPMHLALVRTGGKVQLYVNGRGEGWAIGWVGSKAPPKDAKFPLPNTSWRLGCAAGGPFNMFPGRTSEVRLSKVARYDKDFTPKSRFEPDVDTLALYHLDEGAGDKLTDSSSNGNHGNIVGAKWVELRAPGPWQSLSSGKDLTGLHVPPNLPFEPKKIGRANVSTGDGKGVLQLIHPFGVQTKAAFGDYHLRFEYKVDNKSMSGVEIASTAYFGVYLRFDAFRNAKPQLELGAWGVTCHDAEFAEGAFTVRGNKLQAKAGTVFKLRSDVTLEPATVWQRIEIIRLGDSYLFRVNGRNVQAITNLRHLPKGKEQPIWPMPIGFWSVRADSTGPWADWADQGFRNIEIRHITAVPPEVLDRHTNSLGMRFARIPKGKAWLGGGSGPAPGNPGNKEVEFKHDFYLGVYEVTQGEWEAVMGKNPSAFSRKGASKDAVKDVSDDDLKRFPVESVSHDQCREFLKKLNEKTKEQGWIYRLPTDDEWEYAARGGPMTDKAQSAFDPFFKDGGKVNANSKGPVKVGSHAPNRLGLYDMYGNVWEYCHSDNRFLGPRAIRGGSWGFNWGSVATGHRGANSSQGTDNYGLRVARIPQP